MIARACPYCGGTGNAEPAFSEDISSLQAEAQRIDTLITQLRAQRTLIHQKLNNLSTTTYSLPPELLSNVFSYAYSTPSFSPRIDLQSFEGDEPVVSTGPFGVAVVPQHEPLKWEEILPKPIRLGAICRYWRQVAWNTPTLWSFLDLRPSTSMFSCEAAVALLRLYTQNVGSLGLSIQVVFHWTAFMQMQRDVVERATNLLGDALCSPEVLDKTHVLVLSNPPAMWIPLLSKGFHNLHTLAIVLNGSLHQFPPILITNVPSLRHVSLRGIQDSVSLPVHQLLSLNLRDMPIDLSCSLLLSSRNLISYRIRSAFSPRIEHTEAPSGEVSITFGKIEHLEWVGVFNAWDQCVQQLHLPSLRYLHLRDHIPLQILPWFEALPITLKTLHLTNLWDIRYMIDILSSLPQLENLILEHCDYISCIFEKIETPSLPFLSTEASSPLQHTFLPNLQRLKIGGNFTPYDSAFPTDLGDTIARALRERMRTIPEAVVFSLEIFPVRMIEWSEEATEILRDLIVNHVAPLKIHVDGEEMGWT